MSCFTVYIALQQGKYLRYSSVRDYEGAEGLVFIDKFFDVCILFEVIFMLIGYYVNNLFCSLFFHFGKDGTREILHQGFKNGTNARH